MEIKVGDVVQVDMELMPTDLIEVAIQANHNAHMVSFLKNTKLFKAEITDYSEFWETGTLWLKDEYGILFNFPIRYDYVTVVNSKKDSLCDCGSVSVYGKGATHSYWCSAVKK